MSKWIEAKLADICLQEKGAIISGPFGSNISSKYFVSEGVPVIRGNNLSLDLDKFYDDGFVFVTEQKAEELNCYAIEGDLLFTAAGTIGQVGILQAPLKYKQYVISNKQMRARIDTSKVGLLYAYYWYSSPWMQNYFIRNNKGSTVPLITLSELKEAPIRYPESIQEQQAIVEAIERISKKIDLNREICGELESMAKTLYDYWFVQCDFPDANGKPYRTSGGEMVWNEQLKREIPKAWDYSVIANHIADNKGGDWGKDAPEGNYQKEVVCIRGADFPSINGSSPLNAPVRYILSKNANKALASGDIIVEISGGSPTQSTGRICYINDYTLRRFDREIITSNFCKAFSTKKNTEQYWLYLLWKKLYDAGVLFGFEGKTTGIKNLLFDDFCAQYKIVKPDTGVLAMFHTMVAPMFDKIQLCNIENDELVRLRDWLLPMLMNGQATVAPAESAPKLQVLQPEKPTRDPRFDRWLQTQGVAARGTVDEQTLHDIFDAMDDDDKQ